MHPDVDLPSDHVLNGYEHLLDTHEGHLEAYSEVLDDVDADDVGSVMLVMNVGGATETLPSAAPDVDVEQAMWYMLAAHIDHAAKSVGFPPDQVAKHAVHVLQDSMEEDTP